jgi:glycosyltransferase involved in cell wall biosynthesis
VARIVFADSTNRYDGHSLATQPLGGTESSVCHMAAALARRGHDVACHTNCDAAIEHEGVAWRPLAPAWQGTARPDGADVYVAVQHPRLLSLARRPRRRVMWMMWRPNNLRHYKQVPRMWWYRPRPVFISDHQAAQYSLLLPPIGRPRVVHFGLPEAVRGHAPLASPPPPRAIFASNPVRNLTWLIQIWANAILPRVPGGELHVYGIRDYAFRYGGAWRAPIEPYLPPGLSPAALDSLKVHPTATREALWAAMRDSRAMLYGGHKSEMFCLSLAEAQALGVPAVIRPEGCVAERVRDGETGFIHTSDADFVASAVALLRDDALWRRQHDAALALQQGLSWDESAAQFERAILD